VCYRYAEFCAGFGLIAMDERIKASIKGVFYMLVIAALFGWWQQNWWAFGFMLCLLLFVEKLFRVLMVTRGE
jgi:hypothetical protein